MKFTIYLMSASSSETEDSSPSSDPPVGLCSKPKSIFS